MWKKLLVAGIALLGSFSVAYTYYNIRLNADSYTIGGSVYGQIGAPTRGDRIYLGTKNSNGGNMGWVLLEEYIAENGNANFKGETNSWYAMSTSPLDKTTYFSDNSKIPGYELIFNPNDTIAASRFNEYNKNLNNNIQDKKIVTNYNTEWLNSMWNNEYFSSHFQSTEYGIEALINLGKPFTSFKASDFVSGTVSLKEASVTRAFYIWLIPDFYGVNYANGEFIGHKGIYSSSLSALWVNDTQLVAQCPAMTSYTNVCPSLEQVTDIANPPGLGSDMGFNVNGVNESTQNMNTLYYSKVADAKFQITTGAGPDVFGDWPGENIKMNSTTKYAIRPSVEFDRTMISKIVFSLSQPTQTGSGSVSINEPVKTIGTYKTGEDMKVRLLNDSMKAIFEDILYQDVSIYDKQNLTKTDIALVPDSEILQLKVQANKGSSAYGVNTVSALIFDSTDQFIAYAPLAIAKDGSNTYDLDLSTLNLTVGSTYSIKVINEVYNTDLTEVSPADCSQLSDAFQVKIVKPLSLTYTPTYDPDTSGSDPYEYDKNVNASDVIGHVTSSDGDATNTISIISDLDHNTDGHDDDYKNFELNSSVIPAVSTEIKVKTDGPDVGDKGLKAGTYYFRIQGYDSAGNEESYATVNVTLTVNKKEATVSFKTDTQTRIKIGDTVGIDEFIETNNDELTSTDGSYPPTYNL